MDGCGGECKTPAVRVLTFYQQIFLVPSTPNPPRHKHINSQVAYVCPRCQARVADLPTACNVCSLPLVRASCNNIPHPNDISTDIPTQTNQPTTPTYPPQPPGLLLPPGAVLPPPLPRPALQGAGRQGEPRARRLPRLPAPPRRGLDQGADWVGFLVCGWCVAG